jgi:hypothetical protein
METGKLSRAREMTAKRLRPRTSVDRRVSQVAARMGNPTYALCFTGHREHRDFPGVQLCGRNAGIDTWGFRSEPCTRARRLCGNLEIPYNTGVRYVIPCSIPIRAVRLQEPLLKRPFFKQIIVHQRIRRPLPAGSRIFVIGGLFMPGFQ